MYFSVAVQRSENEWHARVRELPGAVGRGKRPDLALRDAQAHAARILALHLDSEGAHPRRRSFLTSLLGAAFDSAYGKSGAGADAASGPRLPTAWTRSKHPL